MFIYVVMPSIVFETAFCDILRMISYIGCYNSPRSASEIVTKNTLYCSVLFFPAREKSKSNLKHQCFTLIYQFTS